MHGHIARAAEAISDSGSNEQANEGKDGRRYTVRKEKAQFVLPVMLVVLGHIWQMACVEERWHWAGAVKIDRVYVPEQQKRNTPEPKRRE